MMFFLLMFLAILYDGISKRNEVDVATCLSCITLFNDIKEKCSKEIEAKDLNGFVKKIKAICSDYAVGSPYERFCYAVGAREDSTASILKVIFTGIGHLPSEKHCVDLHKKYGQICTDKVKKIIDWKKVDKYSIKELKALLRQENDECKNCLEKSEYVKKLLTHKPEGEL